MKEQQQTITMETSCSSPQEVVTTNLDPLLMQSCDIDNDHPVDNNRRSSILHTPNIHENDEENIDSDKKCHFFKNFFSYMERFSGIIYALLSAFFFTATTFTIKQLGVILFDVFIIRFFIQGFIAYGFIIYKGYYIYNSNSPILLIFIQALTASTGTICFYLALSMLSLSDLTTIRYTQVIWTAVFVFIIYRDRITLSIILACILTFIGVICVAQPSFIFTQKKPINETLELSLSKSSDQRLLGMFIAIICALAIAMSIVLTKKLFEKKVRQSIVMFHFIIVTLPILLIIQIYYWGFSTTNHKKFNIKELYLNKNFLYAIILATIQIIPMIFSQKSIKREHPSIISVVSASEIVFATILQNIFSRDKSNIPTLIGSTLVLTSIIIVAAQKLWQDHHKCICLPTSIEENK
ncbi:unnamed protein product [Rotaria sp. Silwood1]|nr:unnamed protein product [Rotaria sp. Silwood1]CAF3706095.1 unnamed protein product [Rotaria sp. Silwood1]CAF4661067.1 unnamed protein product [Rotaria sp. Silwood1]CAF4870663.1 unnamed protein product [Rotaria sp. Silwood1]